MEWVQLDGFLVHAGHECVYLIETGETAVRLTRWTNGATRHQVAAESARNVIVFPLGRGPGRPGGAPELAALAESAKRYAEKFEAGWSLEGCPAWQHPVVTRTGRVLTEADVKDLADEAERGYDVTAIRPRGGADDCPNC